MSPQWLPFVGRGAQCFAGVAAAREQLSPLLLMPLGSSTSQPCSRVGDSLVASAAREAAVLVVVLLLLVGLAAGLLCC